MKNKSLLMTIAIFVFAMNLMAQPKRATEDANTFTDSRDGKKYKTVKIGTQTWMAENLAYKTKINDDCWIPGDDASNLEKYGYLYTWGTAKIACPTGWHLPSDAEWTMMIDNLGGADVAGAKMKNTNGWYNNENGNNSSGFAGLPVGYIDDSREFSGIGQYGYWWTSTEGSGGYHAVYRSLWFHDTKVEKDVYLRYLGLSVRCIKD